jgi:hypothetical protein
MDGVRTIFEWGWPVIGGAATWFGVQFAAKPYLQFRTLRETVHRQLLMLELPILVALSVSYAERDFMIETHNTEIDRAAQALRESGIRLVAMADAEWLLTKLLTPLGYDLKIAGVALWTLPLVIRKRDRDSLSPALDDEGDKLVSIIRHRLRLPDVPLLSD